VALTTSILSAFTGIPVRKQVSMTGEVTLRGKVLQIGGLKEKLLAAKRGGILEALIPWENQNDLQEVPAEVKKALKITAFKSVLDMLPIALERMPTPVVDADEPGDKPELDQGVLPPAPKAPVVPPGVYTSNSGSVVN
jgi:ATP-dependent Lon protease